MLSLFSCPQRALQLAQHMLWAGLVLLISGVLGAYVLAAHLSIGSQVAAHSLTIIGPALLKLGYVLRLAAQQHMPKQSMPCCVA
ncbi:transmembrane sensor/regulator PpyR [Pseudomonas sp. TMP25]|uniref:transmembrane sensor/regulator PpyR n=1 Tax=Pseudomonas sp. TMP25 TaxID=3136561 RepID=UPI00310173C3